MEHQYAGVPLSLMSREELEEALLNMCGLYMREIERQKKIIELYSKAS